MEQQLNAQKESQSSHESGFDSPETTGLASASRSADKDNQQNQELANQSDQVQYLKMLQEVANISQSLKGMNAFQKQIPAISQQYQTKEGMPVSDITQLFAANGLPLSSNDIKEGDLMAQEDSKLSEMDAELTEKDTPGNEAAQTEEQPAQMKQGVIQRHIGYNTTSNQFEVDGKRPGWRGKWRQSPGKNKSRNHIIPFSYIQDQMAIYMNRVVQNPKSPGMYNIRKLTQSLYMIKTHPSYKKAIRNLLKLEKYMKKRDFDTAEYFANQLLAELNSSPFNVRKGNSSINSSIQENLDCDFNKGFMIYTGDISYMGVRKKVTKKKVLTLNKTSNDILWRTFHATEGNLSFVQNPLNNKILSSVNGPSKGTGGLPVKVDDPKGIEPPIWFK